MLAPDKRFAHEDFGGAGNAQATAAPAKEI